MTLLLLFLNLTAQERFRIISWMRKLIPLSLVVLFHFTKGYNLIMNLLNYLLKLSASQWVTLLLSVLVIAVVVTLLALLLTFVKYWMQGKKSQKTSSLLVQSFEECLTITLTILKNLFEKEQPSDESTSSSQSQEAQASQEDPLQRQALHLVNDLITRIKEGNQ